MNINDDFTFGVDCGGRGYFRGPTNYLCVVCGKSSGKKYRCCSTTTIPIGPKARAPKTTASKSHWKKFCKIFGIDYSKLEFLQK